MKETFLPSRPQFILQDSYCCTSFQELQDAVMQRFHEGPVLCIYWRDSLLYRECKKLKDRGTTSPLVGENAFKVFSSIAATVL